MLLIIFRSVKHKLKFTQKEDLTLFKKISRKNTLKTQIKLFDR